ncbi:hypothetical protein FXF68_31405 [Actinomadura decatromicini]|uniref:Uncharacterized protein n=1 Tax=Actinomadura decatromicini TaxID=2604572 RepID=A0A5D3F849_9ACTN|nr:hypothetical protein FXF68_31405 [Actinomadura decatromicini]
MTMVVAVSVVGWAARDPLHASIGAVATGLAAIIYAEMAELEIDRRTTKAPCAPQSHRETR